MREQLRWLLAVGACGLFSACTLLEDLDGFSTPSADAGTDAPPETAPGDGGGSDGGGDASSPYRDAVLADAPIAYWRMASGATSFIADETSLGNDLILMGTSAVHTGAVTGDADTSLLFEGSTSQARATRAEPFAFPGRSPFTIELWLKHMPPQPQVEYETLLGYATGGGDSVVGYHAYYSRQSGRVVFVRRGSQPYQTVHAKVPKDVFVQLVVTYDGETMRLYLDGVAVSEVLTTDELPARSSIFHVGSYETGDVPFAGAVDEVAIYDRALSLPEIARHRDLALTR